MRAGRTIAGMLAVVALAALGAAAANAQPREPRSTQPAPKQEARVEDDDFGPGDCPCPMCDGSGMHRHGYGPGMHMRGMGGRGPGMHGPGAGFGMGGMGMGGMGMGGPGFGGMGFGRGMGLLAGGGRLAKELDLTDAQVKKLRDIGDQHRREMIRARADLELARMDLGKLLRDDDAGVAATDRQIDTIARMQADNWKSMAAARRAALGVLTAKQREQLRNLRPMWRDTGGEKSSPQKSRAK